jgi:hypothetical protein
MRSAPIRSARLKEEVKMARILSVLFVVALGTAFSTAASAQVPKGSVRLNLDSNLIMYKFGGWNPAGDEDWKRQDIVAGIGVPNLALGVGVTVVDALAIGLRLSIGYETHEVGFDADDSAISADEVMTDFDAMKQTNFRWGIAPYLEYAFMDKVVRPFLMLLLGFEGEKDTAPTVETTFWDFIFGLGGGLHLFGGPNVSVDLTILLGFSAGGGNFTPTVEGAEKLKFTRILFRANGNLGISGWF